MAVVRLNVVWDVACKKLDIARIQWVHGFEETRMNPQLRVEFCKKIYEAMGIDTAVDQPEIHVHEHPAYKSERAFWHVVRQELKCV